MRACVRQRAHALARLGPRLTPFHKNTRRACAPKKYHKTFGAAAAAAGATTLKPRVKVFRGLEKVVGKRGGGVDGPVCFIKHRRRFFNETGSEGVCQLLASHSSCSVAFKNILEDEIKRSLSLSLRRMLICRFVINIKKK